MIKHSIREFALSKPEFAVPEESFSSPMPTSRIIHCFACRSASNKVLLFMHRTCAVILASNYKARFGSDVFARHTHSRFIEWVT